MKIIVLDAATLNPGDLSWEPLGQMGEFEVYPVTPENMIVDRSKDADILITNKVPLKRETILQLPKLKFIAVTATGYNVVDIAAAKERDIPVSNVPIYGTSSVAQMAIALLLELCHHVGEHSRTVHEGKWCENKDFCYWDYPLVELAEQTMGIVGFGRIGQATARIAQALGMKILAYDAFITKTDLSDVEFVDMETLFEQSDVVSLHCPLTAANEKFVNKKVLSLMKKTSFLINTSRGQLVNEQDLCDALNSGRIAAAGLDVLSKEPPLETNPLLKVKNCIITPHIAWATRSARERLIHTTFENVKAFINGKPSHVVSV